MGFTILIYFHPEIEYKNRFIKTLNMFEVVGIVPRLDYILSGPDMDVLDIIEAGREDEVKYVKLLDRDAWVMETNSDEWDQLYSEDSKSEARTGRLPLFLGQEMIMPVYVTLVLENDDVEAMAKVKDRIHVMMASANLFSVQASSFANNRIAYEHLHAYSMGNNTPYNLPYLAVGRHFKSGLIPGKVNWINYWSNETLEAIGFDGAVDKELFYDATRMSKGWYLQLTRDPFNFENPEHIEILKKVYNRFKKIGGQDLIEQGLVPRD